MKVQVRGKSSNDPRASIGFWERMAKSGEGQPPEFLSTHPAHGTRIQRLQEVMPKAVAEYEKSGKANSGGALAPPRQTGKTVGDLAP